MTSRSHRAAPDLELRVTLDGRMVSKHQLGREAIRIEQEVLKECVGCQDQLWAAYGGFNRIEFFPDGSFAVRSAPRNRFVFTIENGKAVRLALDPQGGGLALSGARVGAGDPPTFHQHGQ